jgi:hypothetical protein
VGINKGDVAVVKTTGEYVYVVEVSEVDGAVIVNRPVLTQNGIRHERTTFSLGELETNADHIRRDVEDKLLQVKAQQDVMNAKIKAMEEINAEQPNDEPDFTLN